MNDTNGAELTEIGTTQWEEARRCLSGIQRLAQNPKRTRADVLAVASDLGCSRAHVYELLLRYQRDRRLTSLLPRRRGPERGRSLLSPEIDRLVHDTIETVYLRRQRPKITDLVAEIRKVCHDRRLKAPSRKAISTRLRLRPRKEIVARREGRKAARDRFAPVTGSLEATGPLDLVQIDHTLVDVIVVDCQTRRPIQRPWLTLAIDVFSRCVVGFYLSLEAPSATSVALCIAHAVLPKDRWLASRRIDVDYPIHGRMHRLHLDNAKEFRSEALRRGCEEYGIGIEHRPVRTPHYGGHIERLIGTMMGKVHLLPGTTFSSVEEKGDFDPESTAALTLDELERWLTHAIAGVYHCTVHRSLGIPPLTAWRQAIEATVRGRGSVGPVAIEDQRRFLIDFLPIEHRLVRRDGVTLFGIHYWSDVLGTWIGEPKKMIVRYDPRDLSRIYLLAPDGHCYDLSYRDVRRPPITRWEHRLALKRLREEGLTHVDESAIFRTVEIMRTITEEAVAASKKARRQHERRVRLTQGQKPEIELNPPRSAVDVAEDDDYDETVPACERMLPVEEW